MPPMDAHTYAIWWRWLVQHWKIWHYAPVKKKTDHHEVPGERMWPVKTCALTKAVIGIKAWQATLRTGPPCHTERVKLIEALHNQAHVCECDWQHSCCENDSIIKLFSHFLYNTFTSHFNDAGAQVKTRKVDFWGSVQTQLYPDKLGSKVMFQNKKTGGDATSKLSFVLSERGETIMMMHLSPPPPRLTDHPDNRQSPAPLQGHVITASVKPCKLAHIQTHKVSSDVRRKAQTAPTQKQLVAQNISKRVRFYTAYWYTQSSLMKTQETDEENILKYFDYKLDF